MYAIVSCVKSKAGLRDVSETALSQAFLPTLVNTVTPEERRTWRVSLYLCADDTDMFYVSNAAAIRNLSATLAPWLNLQLLFYPATKTECPIARQPYRRTRMVRSTCTEQTMTSRS